ncbi:GNAT family N-acetyltransferase [Bifidobacterium simiarum]|uniref:GNAT family N-acetyltransferase n=1 Tax=Bifidobacterium simiarum TaxID=2045441 RepID=A0A2M9HD63_9BIFI|nr:GNAT family N-acetyltransferase [Bifidobacterium simiarum]MBT1166248.1 GNAT family N-acetyltransferase [Bifidobacterium simiarum]PJM74736.1 GNAT family N-acetyltransferase [Bifidobacterium simiarum]
MIIRHATMEDAGTLAAIEGRCFPAAEAASPEAIRSRVASYPECFWLLCTEDRPDAEIVSFINGFATDQPDLTDDMYDDASQHDPHGDWQMIFGVDTAPEFQHHGYASLLMRHVIDDVRAAGRKGLVLTCKDRLVGFYARFGYVDEGISDSTHGDVVWHQMRLTF